jgi:hypothetical protein
MGCDQYQGFFRSAAVAPADVESLLAPTGAHSMEGEQQSAERTYSKLGRLRGR